MDGNERIFKDLFIRSNSNMPPTFPLVVLISHRQLKHLERNHIHVQA